MRCNVLALAREGGAVAVPSLALCRPETWGWNFQVGVGEDHTVVGRVRQTRQGKAKQNNVLEALEFIGWWLASGCQMMVSWALGTCDAADQMHGMRAQRY